MMDDNHPSSSSSDYLHQRAGECDATPDNSCTRSSTSQARRKLSVSYVNAPASTSQLDFGHESAPHHLNSTPSRIPILPSTLSSRVTPPTLLTRTVLPLTRPDRSHLPSIASATFSSLASHFMTTHSSPNGPQASSCFLATPGPLEKSSQICSSPTSWAPTFARASPASSHFESPSDRTTPTQSPPADQHAIKAGRPCGPAGRKRERARSLPNTPPKRKKCRSQVSFPLSARTPRGSTPTHFSTRPESCQTAEQADRSDRTEESSRCRTQTAPLCRTTPLISSIRAPSSQDSDPTPMFYGRRLEVMDHTPSLQPPITIQTLSELEAHELLKGVQVRHDLQFEDVAIRSPTSSTRKALQRVRMHMERADASPPSVGRANQYHESVMYWQTVEIEATTGCRCVSWQVRQDIALGQAGVIVQFRRRLGCVCGGWMLDIDSATWRTRVGASAYPSRFIEMLAQLRLILVALMGSTVRSPGPVPYSDSEAIAAERQRQQDAQTANNLVQNLLASVDPDHLADQVRHGALGIELFAAIGEAMKHHCAPARDAMVDEMVRLAEAGHIGLGFQKIFECAEAMKVDIVNHHLHQYRPAIMQVGPELERTTLRHLLRNTFLERSDTRTWLREASTRVIAAAPQSDRLHLMGRCICASSYELSLRAAVDGFVELAFMHWDTSIDVPLWPTSAVAAVDSLTYSSIDPEVFRMDGTRIRRFIAIAYDIYNTSMILHFFRSLFSHRHPGLSQPELTTQVEGARIDLEILQQELCVTGTLPDTSYPAEWSLTLARRIVCPPELDAEVDDRAAVLPCTSAEDAADIYKIASQLESLRPGKDARATGQKRLRALLVQLLTDAVSASLGNDLKSAPRCKAGQSAADDRSRFVGASSFPLGARFNVEEDKAIAKAGFAAVSDRVRDLVSRMEPLVSLNVLSFKDFYALKGMLAGSGEPTEDEMRASQQWRKDFDQHVFDNRVWVGPSPFATHHRH